MKLSDCRFETENVQDMDDRIRKKENAKQQQREESISLSDKEIPNSLLAAKKQGKVDCREEDKGRIQKKAIFPHSSKAKLKDHRFEPEGDEDSEYRIKKEESERERDRSIQMGGGKTISSEISSKLFRKKDPGPEIKNGSKDASICQTKSRILSLKQHADIVCGKIPMITLENRLHAFNGKCYDSIDAEGFARLYRKEVDPEMTNISRMRDFAELYQCIRTDPKLDGKKKLKKGDHFCVFHNGLYDIEREQLIPHSSKYAVFSYLNAHYNPIAKCKRFERFLWEVCGGDEELVERFWYFIAYLFMQSMEAKVFFVLGTAPDSGKSVVGTVIAGIYPDVYVSTVALTDLSKEFYLEPLAGKALNCSMDLPAKKLNDSDVSKLKMLTGNDSINVNGKHVRMINLVNRAKLVFATNHPIKISTPDEAFWNRLVYLPFNRTIPKEDRDTGLVKELLAEMDGIATKAMKYAKKLIERNFVFPSTLEIENTLLKWQGKQDDRIDEFLQSCCTIGEDGTVETMETLYTAYNNYCTERNICPAEWKHLKGYLEDALGLKHCKSRADGSANPKSAFKGICLLETK